MTFCLCTLLLVAISSPWNPQNIFEAQTSAFTPPSVYTYPLYLSSPYFNISASLLQCLIPTVFNMTTSRLVKAGLVTMIK